MSLVGENMDIKLDMLEEITNKFAEDRKVGSGPYGDVYRGVYNGQEIVVKKIHDIHGLDDSAFLDELHNLCKIDHPNVVRLIGYCREQERKFITYNGQLIVTMVNQRAICYQYVEGRSLDWHISDESCVFDWPTCYKIIKGICEGLKHLHCAQEKPIYHLDLTLDNILLDENKTAKISGLGLSRLVSSTKEHKAQISIGTRGYMPPEYIDSGITSRKFDVFSLGLIIMAIMAGHRGHLLRYEMPRGEVVELVTRIWKKKLHDTSGHSSQEINIVEVKTCVDIALRCVNSDQNRRPLIKDIVSELDELEATIKKMTLYSDQPKDLIGLQKRSDSSILTVDPTLELRFVFEPRKDLSCCLQLTNKTDSSIAFNIKTNNQTKYCTEPNKGIMPPCSKCYVCVTLQAQEEAPPNMQCNDMFTVQSVNVSDDMDSDDITEDFFKRAMVEKVVDVVKLPIVYVARGQFPC